MNAEDTRVADALGTARVIAVVGASANPHRPSHYVSLFLQSKGHRVIPVNPGLAGQTLFGEIVHESLSAIGERVDMVDIFRRPVEVPGIVEEALGALPGLRTIWMQLGISHAEAAARGRAAGVAMIENRCPIIEYERLNLLGLRA